MELLRQMLGLLPVPAQVWDGSGRVLHTNRAFNRTLGYPEDLIWENAGLQLGEDPQVVAAGLSERIHKSLSGTPVEITSFDYDAQHLNRGADRRTGYRRISISIRPLNSKDGKINAIVCMLTDHGEVSERLERDLMRSQKMENVEALASSVAHEFNNIFTGIRGLSELIKDSVERSSEVYEFAESIQENILRGAELINKLTSFARELPHTLRVVKLSDYIQHALPLLNIQVQRRVNIETDLRCDALVLLDASRMDQALTNIVGNAKDAMGGGGTVRLSLSEQLPPNELLGGREEGTAPWVLLEVADSGPGIPPELAERVMLPFFSTKERGKSTGLGLSVTQRIIELHNGLLSIGRSSELGGAAIRIYLPVAEAQRDNASELSEAR